mgnify:CR=1 FL=1
MRTRSLVLALGTCAAVVLGACGGSESDARVKNAALGKGQLSVRGPAHLNLKTKARRFFVIGRYAPQPARYMGCSLAKLRCGLQDRKNIIKSIGVQTRVTKSLS